MKAIDFTVVGDAERAKVTAVDALQQKGFRIEWSDEWSATAEKGSKVKNALLGGFAQYIKLGLEVRSASMPGHSVIRLTQGSKGYAGGALGVSKTNKARNQLRDELAAIFQNAGVLVNVAESG
jgi:hypothetical protein